MFIRPGHHAPSFQPRKPNQGFLVSSVAARVKQIVTQQGVDKVQNHIFRIGKTLRLTDENGEWTGPPEAECARKHFPRELSLEAVFDFIDAIALANEQNEYLMEFADSLPGLHWDEPENEASRSFAGLIPELVAFALVLQGLSSVFYLDVDLVERVLAHWEKEIKKSGLHNSSGPGFRIKFESIRLPIRRSRECVLAGEVPKRFCNFILPFNIYQATAYDALRKNYDNARAGLVLARHRPGNKPDPATAAGPVHFDQAGRVIESGLPLAQKWADLYQTWNLAFGAQFSTFPFYLCKLVIPQVAAYQARPQQYVWNRTHALMTYLYFVAFATFDYAQDNSSGCSLLSLDWQQVSGSGLHRIWGKFNRHCAADYASRVRVLRGRER